MLVVQKTADNSAAIEGLPPGKNFSKMAGITNLPIQLAYLYLSVPMFCFFSGWLRIPVALGMELVLALGLFFALRSAPKMEVSPFTRGHIPQLLLLLLLSVVWVYLSGIGKYAFQNEDHMFRNAIFEKLVENDWPVIIQDGKPYFQKPIALVYYFALWLPAACLGKAWGMDAAYFFLFCWCVLGVFLVMILLEGLMKKISPWLVMAFIFFSGLDVVGYLIRDCFLHNSPVHLLFAVDHIEHWAPGFQMSSMSTQLFWVFNQAIPAWLITLLLLLQKDNRSIIWIYSFGFLSCTLPSIGLIPIVAYIGIRRMAEVYDTGKTFKRNALSILHEAFTFQNAICGLLVAAVSYLFLKTNAASRGGFHMTDMTGHVAFYLLTVLLEFLVYYMAIYSRKRHDPLYWLSLAILFVVPAISLGSFMDFCMRASIPALVVLFVLTIGALDEYHEAKDLKHAFALVVFLALGAVTPFHEIARSIKTTIEHGKDPEVRIVAKELDILGHKARNNFFGEYEDSFFFKYLARESRVTGPK